MGAGSAGPECQQVIFDWGSHCKCVQRNRRKVLGKFANHGFFATNADLCQSCAMTILSVHPDNPLVDGRQSERAMLVRRGMQRLLASMRLVTLPELALSSGRRADLITLSEKGEIWIIEIKSSIEDFKVDRKWPDYRQHCDRLFFATHKDVPLDIFPEDCGLFLSDGYGAHMIREAPEHRLSASMRKSVTLSFARVAAQRITHAELAAERQGKTIDTGEGDSDDLP